MVAANNSGGGLSVETTAEPARRAVRVGLTVGHGMTEELIQFPPPGIEYFFLPVQSRPRFSLLRSPIKAYTLRYQPHDCDLIEAILVPLRTDRPWIFSCDVFQAATTFSLRGLPLPRALRVAYVRRMLLRDNCKRIVFWSQAGLATMSSYGGIHNEALTHKATVVYPAVRKVDAELIRFNDGDVNLLFTGDFFRKGGVNVLDAFDRLRKKYPGVTLNLCCDERIDFRTPNTHLRNQYLEKARTMHGVSWLGRINRDDLIQKVLPRTDVYLLPTYAETFGFAILEAMAFGIPVVATNVFAIPEMVENGKTGLLIDTTGFDAERWLRGYVVNTIPAPFREHVTDVLYAHLCSLVESSTLRRRLGMEALRVASTKFSFATRNERMLTIYRAALQ
jgi:glycosyltransferase involved in cell wall biosynthesis